MDLIKSLSLFDPAKLQGKNIAVIGAGATGSMTVLQLAKLGLKDITVFDFDKIEGHNIPNQLVYGMSDIGEYKVDALARRVNELVGENVIEGVIKEVKGFKLYFTHVFFCVDTMKARDLIFNKAVFLNGFTEMLVDMRMNARTAISLTLDPRNLGAVDAYRSELYTDGEVEPLRGTCGNVLSLGPTASLTSSLAIWQFIEFINNPKEGMQHSHLSLDTPWDLTNFTVA